MLCTSCSLFDDSHKKEELPPITQEGRNTFGCLVNGEVWLPKGYNGTSNLDASYDPTYKGGALDVSAYRITDHVDQFVSFGVANISSTGKFEFSKNTQSPGAYWDDANTFCSYDDKSNELEGYFIVTRLDLMQAIVSGTFEFTMVKAGCDTIKVTEGRFDMKF